MSLRGYVKKGKPALWQTAFPKQVKHVKKVIAEMTRKYPELKGGKILSSMPGKRLRTVSIRQAARLAEYRKVARAWVKANPFCAVCQARATIERPVHVHHVRGRISTLLTDTRFFLAMHDDCHRWVHDNPKKARKMGLLAKQGDWGRQP